jgi:hypothetical protein
MQRFSSKAPHIQGHVPQDSLEWLRQHGEANKVPALHQGQMARMDPPTKSFNTGKGKQAEPSIVCGTHVSDLCDCVNGCATVTVVPNLVSGLTETRCVLESS